MYCIKLSSAKLIYITYLKEKYAQVVVDHNFNPFDLVSKLLWSQLVPLILHPLRYPP